MKKIRRVTAPQQLGRGVVTPANAPDYASKFRVSNGTLPATSCGTVVSGDRISDYASYSFYGIQPSRPGRSDRGNPVQ